ncbi:MAG: hypothetical protein HamCj_05490 [Candidatus Hamiltonella defensa (Ceratovacuna japonica)]
MQYQKIAKQIIRRFALAFLMQTEPVFSTESIENKKNYILDKETYNEGIDIKGQSTVENQGALSVSTSSKKTPAIKVNEGSTLTLKGSDNKWINVTTSEKKSSGLLASGSGTEITANKMDINTKGEGSDGVKAEYDASIIINESQITSEGDAFNRGVWARGKQSNLIGNHLKIKVKGKEARGVSAQSGATVVVNGSVIHGEGEDVNGILASDENTNLEGNNLTVEVEGQDGYGIKAYRGATVNIQNNSVITTQGASAHAAVLFDKATLNVRDSYLKTTGADSAVLYMDAPPNNNKKRKNRAEITGGSLEASGNLILSDGGIHDVFLNNVLIHSPGSGYLLQVLNSDVNHPTEVNLVINQEKAPKRAKTLRGNIFAAPGNKANVTLNKSGLIGWANATHLSVDPDSTWSMTRPSTLKHLKNEGKVEFQSPGATSSNATGTSGYTTLSLGSLSGTGMFWMNTDIAGHQGDFIDVTGKAKGDFGVRVNDSGKSPQPEDSLKIIQTGGGDAKFTLANEGGLVDVGTYQYYLIPDDRNQVPDERERVLDDRQRSWSLVSHQPQPSPKSQPESEPNPQTPVSSTLSPTAAVNTEQLQPDIPHPASSSLEPNSNSTLFVNANTLTASEIATGTPVSGEILTREMTPQPEPHSLDEKPVPVAEALTEDIEHKEKQILEKEIYNEGIEVTGQNAVENKGALSVITRNQNSPAVTVTDGATLILKGAQDKLVTVTTSGNTSPGLVASGTGTEMTADKIHVTTNGEDSEGLKSEDGATVIVTGSKINAKGDGSSVLLSEGDANLTVNNLTVESNGKDGRGIKASRGAQVNLEDSTVTGTGEYFSGIWAHGEKTHLEGKNITITLNDKNGTGVKAYRGATVDMTGSHINGEEDNFSGLSAYQNKTNLTGSNIHIESKGKNGRGVTAGTGAEVTIKDNSSITGEGENFVGLFAEKEKTNLKSNKTTIKVKNKNGRGVQASNQAEVVIEESKIIGEGEEEDFVGLLAEGNNTSLTGDKVEIEISNQNSRGIKAVDGAKIDIKHSTINGTGNDFLGILAEGDKTNLTGNNVEIQVNAEGGTGVLAQNEANVVIHDSKITGKSENFVGVVADQENTNLKGKKLTVALKGANGKGISAVSGAQVKIEESKVIGAEKGFLGLSAEGDKTNLEGNSLTIESNGKSGTGLEVASGARMMINDSDITGTGGDFSGVLAYHDINFEGKNLNIKVAGADGKGVNAYKDAKIYIEGSTIIGTEENFTGLSASQDNTQLDVNKTTIESQAKNGKGVTATSGAQVSIDESTITSEGEKFLGLSAYLENTHLMGNKINMTLKGKNGTGVDVQNGGNTTINNSTLIGEGDHFLGLSAYGEDSTLTVNNLTMNAKGKNSKAVEVDKDARVNIQNRSVITTEGASSPAMQLNQKGRLNINDSDIKTTGENSAIFYVAPGKSQQKSVAGMTGGLLEARGDLILSEGGTMDLVLNNVSVSPPGSSYLLNVLNSDSGYPGEVHLSVFNPIGEKDPTKTLWGNIVAAEGSKANVTLNNSHLIGWAKATNMSIDPASQWSITGPSTVKQLKNEGKIEFQAPSATSLNSMGTPGYKTLSLGSLSGNGMFWMNTDIAGHRGDFLNVTGKAEGDFGVKVTDSGQSPTADDSLKIIQTGGGDAKFTLANEGGVVDVGTYQYYLVADDSNSVPDDSQRVLDDRKRGWSLVSHQSQIKTATKGTELNIPTPVTASSSETGANKIVTEGMTQLPQPDAPPASTSAPPPFISEIASAQKTLFDDGKSHILRDNLYLEGIEVKNSTTVENLENNQGVLLVSSSSDSKNAVKVSEGSTVTLKGAEDKLTTLTTIGTDSHGLHAAGAGTQVTANRIDIKTHHDRSQGIKTGEGATVNIQNSTITANGENAYGLLAEGENTNLVGNHLKINIHGEDGIGVAGRKAQKVNIEDSVITGTRNDFLGLVAEHTDLEGKNLEIKVKGKNSKGVTTLDSKVNIQGSTISSDGEAFVGLVALEDQSKLSVNKTTITANGQDSKGVKVEKGAKVDVQESTITGHGKNFYGLLASEDQSKLRVNKTTIITNGEDSKGVKAEKGAKVDVKDSTITGHGKNFYGLLASADQSKLEVSKTTITANGQSSRGFQVLAGAEGMIEDSTITNNGDNSYGLWADKARLTGKKVTIEVKEGQKGRGVIARNHAHVTLNNDSKITGTGKDFLGLWAYGNQTNLEANNLTIDIKGKNGEGVSADGGAHVSLKDSRMTGDADAFVGFVASDDQSKLTVNNTTITANGQNSRGLKAVKGAEVTVKDSIMTSTGDNFDGLWALGDKTHLEGNNLTLDLKEGQRSRGVIARNSANVILNDSKIIGTGQYFLGLSADGEHATLTVNNLTMNAKGKNSKAVEVAKNAQVNIQNGSVITTEGAFSPAIQLTQKGRLNVSDSAIKTLGKNSATFYVAPSSSEQKSVAEMTGGSLEASGDLILSQGGTMDVVLNQVSVSSPGSGYLLNVLNSGSGHPGEVNLSVFNPIGEKDPTKTLRGNIFAAEGSKANVTLNNSHLIGWAKATNMSIDPTSHWSITGLSTLKQLKNEGKVEFQSPSATSLHSMGIPNYTTLSLETLSGTGLFWMNTDIAGHQGDFLNVTRKAEGEFGVMVKDSGQSPRADDSLKIIQTGGGDAKFTLANEGGVVDVGTYQYYLVPDDSHQVPDDRHRVLDDRARGWSLLSHQPQPAEKPQPESEPRSQNPVTPPSIETVSAETPESAETAPPESEILFNPLTTKISSTVTPISGETAIPEGVVQPNLDTHPDQSESLAEAWFLSPTAYNVGEKNGPVSSKGKPKEKEKNIFDDGGRHVLIEHGVYDEGIEIKKQSTVEHVENKGDLSVSTSNENSPAFKVSEGSTLTLRGIPDKLMTVTTTGEKSSGLFASGIGTEVSAGQINITTMGQYSQGVKSKDSAKVVINQSKITGTGENSYGLWATGDKTNLTGNHLEVKIKAKDGTAVLAHQSARVMLNHSKMTGEGDSVTGVFAYEDNTNLAGKNLEIEMNGQNNKGIKAYKGATINIKDSRISGRGNSFKGISASEEKTNLEGKNLNIKIMGNNGKSVNAYSGATVILHDSSMSGEGDFFYGIDASNEKTTLTGNQLKIESKGQYSRGVQVFEGAQANIEGSKIIGRGRDFYGLSAFGEKTTLTGSQLELEVNGQDSRAVRAENGATLNLSRSTIISNGASSPALWSKASTLKVSDSHIKTTGENSPILYTEDLNPTKSKSIVEITNGHLNASGDLIVSKGGLMDVTLNNVSILSPDNHNVLKVMNQGNVNLEANKTTLTGHIFADVNSQADLKLINESALIGQVNAENLFIDPDSSWSLTGNSFLKNLSHEGDIRFQSQSNSDLNETYSRLSLESLNGHGTFWMNTNIAAQKGDFLNVTGEANGHFGVRVADSGKNPKPEDTLQIIQTGGGNADFILANPGQVVDVGTYQYRLVPDDLKRGWSLMSHQSQSSSPPQQGQGSDPEPEVNAPVVDETTAAVTPISGEQEAPDVSEVRPESKIPTLIERPVIDTAAAVTPISAETKGVNLPEVLPQPHTPTLVDAPAVDTAAAVTPIPGETKGVNLPEVLAQPHTPTLVDAPVVDTAATLIPISGKTGGPDSPSPTQPQHQTPTLSESEPTLIQKSGPNLSIITIEGQKNHTFKKKTYHQGIEIKGQSTVENTDALSVSTLNQNTPAITVSEGSLLNLDGAGDKLVTLKTSEINSPGLVASGTETEIRANKMDISTEGRHAHAVTSKDGAKVVINQSTIRGTGDRFYGLSANGEQTNLRGNQLQIQVKGKDGRGVSSQNGSTVMIDASTIIGEGDSFRGLLASDGRSHLTGNNLTIELQGKDGIGVKAQKGAKVIIDDSTITGEGESFRSLLPSKETSEQVGSQDTIGVVALSDARVNISNSTINGNGRYSLGLLASGEQSSLTGSHLNIDLNAPDSAGVIAYKGATVDLSGKSTITTRGASSHAALLSEKSTLKIRDSEIKTTGADSAILYGFAPDHPGEKSMAEITGGSLDARGDLIFSKGGIMDVVLKNVSISSPGSGHVLKAFNNSEINLTVNQTKLPGSVLALNGSKINMSLNGSDLVGGVTNATSLSIDPKSNWSVTRNSVLGDLNHEGKIAFKSEDNTKFHRITTKTLNGTGMFWMNTDIARQKGDFLNVTGKARGHFGVMVSDSGQSPKPDDTLKIIQTGGGDAQFTLANPGHAVDVGTYKYYLVPDDNHRVLDDRERGWSLVSHQPRPSLVSKARVNHASHQPQPALMPAPAPPVLEAHPDIGIETESPVVLEKVAATKPVSETTVTSEVTEPPQTDTFAQTSVSEAQTPEAQSVFLSSTAYKVDKIEPVLSKETIEGKENYILEEDYREGIEVKGQSTVTNSTLKNKKMLSVSSSHAKSPAVKASEGSTVTLKGNEDKLVTVRTSGNQSPGLHASGISTNITADKINIVTEGKSSEGVKAEAGGKVIINNSIITGEGENFNKGLLASGAQSNLKGNNLAITINGDHGEGVIAEQGAEVTLEDSTINIEKDSVLNNGITASGGNTHLKGNNLTMNVNGINGRGVNVMHGANVNIEDSRLTGKGTNFQGLNADGYGTNLTANKMKIEVDVGLDVANKMGAGVLATRAGKIDIKDSTITGKGTSFSVLRAEEDNAHLKGNNLTISVAGKTGTGVTAKNGGTAVINDSTITSTEEDFVGLVAQNNSNVTGKNITIDASAKNGSGVTALINSHVNIEDTTITGKGENFLGLASVGENANMKADKMEIELNGQNVTGVTAVNGAKVIINHSNITESGENAYGVLAAGDKSTLKADHLDIEANGGGSTGVKVINGAKVILDDSDVTENGENAYGLSVEGEKSILEANKVEIKVNASGGTGVKSVSGGTVSIEDSEITGTDQDFLGILVHGDKSHLEAKQMLIEIKDKDSKAVVAEKGATVNIEDSRLVSEGDTFVGLVAYQDKSKLTGNKLNIEIKNGQKGKAVIAEKGAQTSIENSTIISTGKDFWGLSASAEKSNLKAKKITMQVNGEQSKGAMAESGASLIIDDSTMIGNSTDFYGLWARGKNTNLTANNTNIVLNGEDAKGITVENEATANINDSTMTTHQKFSDVVRLGQKGTFKARDSHLKANGEGSAILYVEDPDNTKQKSVVEITRGSLESSKGSLIVSKGGTMDVVLNSVDISSPVNAYALKVIHGGEVNLDVNQTTLPGNIFADSRSKANVTLKGSELTGWATGTNLSIDPESTWSITGDSGWKSLSHTGKIQFKSDTGPSVNPITSNRYSRLSLESMSGTGMFWMNTDIAGHQGDFIDVKGEANGQFDVMVTDSGNSPKAGDTLKIIETGGGAADFILANQGQKVDVGTYQYYLVPDELKRSWSLISHQDQKETATEQGVESHPSAPNIASSSELNPELGVNSPSIEAVSAQTPISGETVPAVQAPQPSVETATRVLEAPQPGSSTTEPIVTQKRIFDDGQTHTLMDGSTYNQGIEVKNTTTVNNGGALLLSSTTENSPAVKVSEASTVTLKGAEDKLVTLTTRGAESHGLHASGTGTQVTANKIDITTHRDGTQGVKVDEGARVNIEHSTMTGNGEDAYGLWAGGEKTNVVGNHLKIKINAQNGTGVASIAAQKVNIEDSEITGTGDEIFGLVAQYTDLEGKNVEIGVKGKNGKGLRAIQAAKVNINDSKMVGEGENFQGIFAHGERTNVTVKKLKIEAKGKNGEGVMALSGSHVNIQNSTLSSDEEAFVGLSASEDKSNLMVNKTTIKANGQDSKGVKAEKGATVDIQESTINSTGENFDGLVADNAKLTGNKVTIDVKEGQKGRGVVARNHAHVRLLNDSKISGTGNDFFGLWAYGNQTNLEANHLTLEIAGQNGKGVSAQSEANVIINDSTMTSTGEAFVGLLASGDKTHLTGNHLNIQANAQDSKAVKVEKGAKVDIQQGTTITGNGKNFYGLVATEDQSKLIVNQTTITANGQYGIGLQVLNGAEGMIEDSTITSTGENFHSLWADKSNLKGKKLTIESKGEKGRGVTARNEARVMINDSKITGKEKDFIGLWARGKNTYLTGKNLEIDVKSKYGKGVSAQNEAHLMIEESTITGDGEAFTGLMASKENTDVAIGHLRINLNGQRGKGVEVTQSAHLKADHLVINANAQDSAGIMALSDSMVNLNNSKIIGKDSLSLGLLASGDKTNLTGNHINMELNGQNSLGVVVEKGATINMKDSTMTTLGVLSHAARLSKKGTLNVTDSRITTLGENSAILYVDSDDPKQKSAAEITRGFLEASGDLILSKGAALDVVLNNVAISSPGSGYALNVLNSDSGHPGNVNLVVNETTLPGRIFTAKGSKAQVRLKRSELIGQVDATNLSIDADSTWTLTGNSVLKELIHGGKIAFKPYRDMSFNKIKAIDYSTLYLDTLSGEGGTFWMNTDIAGYRGDFLHVRGEANGHFGVMVTDSGESPKAEDSLKIIQTGGGNAEFNLANPGKVVDVGTYQYHLVPDDLKRAWSLVSHQPQPAEKPQPESESPPKASVIPSVTETVSAASRPISGDTLLPQETEYPVQPGIGSPKATELKPEAPVTPSVPEEKEALLTPVSGETVAPAVIDETQTGKLAPKAPEPKPEVPVAPSVPEEKEAVLTPVSGEAVAPAVTDETQTRKLAAKAPEPKPEVPVAPSVPEEKEAVLTPVSGETVAPAVTDETQTGKLAPKAPELKPEVPVAPSVPEEKETVLTPVSGETVAPTVTDETQTRKLAPKAPELKPEAPVAPSVEKEGEKKVAPNRLLSPPTNVSRTNRAPDIPSITPSTAAVLSMSTVGPLIYHSEMAQIQERMSETRQAKTEDTVWVKVMNERHNISQKAGDGYGLRLNGLSVGADCTIRLGRGYTTRGVFFTHSDDKLNFRGKAIGGGRVRSWSAGTYAAYYHDSGFWLDGILKANRFSQEIRGRMTGGGDAFGDFSTLALGASIRGGKDMVAGEMTFTPYLSLSGLRTTRSSLSLSNGMKGDISAQRSVLGKVGLRALYQTRIKEVSVTPWVDVGAEREFIKNNRVRINQRDSFDNDLSGITGVYSLGLSANISQTWNISATAGYKKGKHVESPWNASLGMSLKF